MNIYCGVDIVEIDRIRRSVEKTPGFLMRFFGDNERKLFEDGKNASRIAAAFAAKEAFAKAIKTGIAGFSLNEVELLRNEQGAPYLYLSGKAKEIAEEKKLEFDISISHEKHTAVAMVVAYKK